MQDKWYSRRENITSDFENGLFKLPKRKLNTDWILAEIPVASEPDNLEQAESESLEHPPLKLRRLDAETESPVPPFNTAEFRFANKVFDTSARDRYKKFLESVTEETSLKLLSFHRPKDRSYLNDEHNKSDFSKLFDPSLLSSSESKQSDMGNAFTSLFSRRKNTESVSQNVDELKQYVDAMRLPVERKSRLVPYDDSIVIGDDDNAIDLTFIDDHPLPHKKPAKSRAIEVQPIPVNTEAAERALDSSKVREIDLRRADHDYKRSTEANERQAKYDRYSKDSSQLEQQRYRTQITNEEKNRLRLGLENLVIDIPKPSESFPELPPEAVSLVSKAWQAYANEDEVFVETPQVKIKRKDLKTLSGLDWLNDEVINFYLDLIVQRAKKDGSLPKVHAFLTQFYSTLAERGYAGVKRWTRKVDVFSYDIWIVPVHLTHHWCMAIVDLPNKRIEYYDSLLGHNRQVFDLLKSYIAAEMLDKKKETIETKDWECVRRNDIPTQQNGSDCGMFACKFAEYASRRADIDFSQKHMPYFRKRIVYEICQQSLM